MRADRRSSRPNPNNARRSLKNACSLSLKAHLRPKFLPRRIARIKFSSICILPAVPTIGSWNTRPMYLARLYSGIFVTSILLMVILPSSTGNTPAMEFSNVLLPAPLPPITVQKSPSSR